MAVPVVLVQRVRQTGQLDDWVRYFSRGLELSAIRSLERIRMAQALARRSVATLREANVRGVAIQVAEDLIGYSLMAVTDVESRYGVTCQTATLAVSRLVELGVLEQISEGNYNRVFAANPILDVFRS